MAIDFDWFRMDEDEFVRVAERVLWSSAFASNNPRAPAHKQADDAYAEADRRGKPWLYQRAWNKAYRSCGYEPSANDLERAKDPALTTHKEPV